MRDEYETKLCEVRADATRQVREEYEAKLRVEQATSAEQLSRAEIDRRKSVSQYQTTENLADVITDRNSEIAGLQDRLGDLERDKQMLRNQVEDEHLANEHLNAQMDQVKQKLKSTEHDLNSNNEDQVTLLSNFEKQIRNLKTELATAKAQARHAAEAVQAAEADSSHKLHDEIESHAAAESTRVRASEEKIAQVQDAARKELRRAEDKWREERNRLQQSALDDGSRAQAALEQTRQRGASDILELQTALAAAREQRKVAEGEWASKLESSRAQVIAEAEAMATSAEAKVKALCFSLPVFRGLPRSQKTRKQIFPKRGSGPRKLENLENLCWRRFSKAPAPPTENRKTRKPTKLENLENLDPRFSGIPRLPPPENLKIRKPRKPGS